MSRLTTIWDSFNKINKFSSYTLDICKISRWLGLITISSIKSVNFKFLYFKIMHKIWVMDWIVNNIWFIQNLTWVLRI